MKRILAMSILASLATIAVAQEAKPTVDPAKMLADIQRQVLAKFDVNKDGILSGEEQLMAQEAMRRAGGVGGLGLPPGGFPAAEQFIKQFDKDGNGKLSDAEQLAASAAFQRMRGDNSKPVAGAVPAANQIPATGAGVPAAGQGAAKPSKLSGLAKRFDLDGDGKLSDAEKAALQADANKKKTKPRSDDKSKP